MRPREHADLRRRNSSQHWFRRDLDVTGHGGKRMRPRCNLIYNVIYLFTCAHVYMRISSWLSYMCYYSTHCSPPSPSSMIETSTFRHHGQSFSVDMTPVNPAAPDLLAQLFWTAASLLESDYEGEYTMALRLMSRVRNSPMYLHCTYMQYIMNEGSVVL